MVLFYIRLKGQKCPVLSLSYFLHIYLIAEFQGSSKAPLGRKLVNHQAKKISLLRHRTPNVLLSFRVEIKPGDKIISSLHIFLNMVVTKSKAHGCLVTTHIYFHSSQRHEQHIFLFSYLFCNTDVN